MDKSEALKKLGQYRKLLAKEIPVKEMILFGSYAKGTAHEDSDLDVAVIINTPSDDFFSIRPALWKIRRDVDDRIEPILFAGDKDDSGFLEEIRRTGIVIH